MRESKSSKLRDLVSASCDDFSEAMRVPDSSHSGEWFTGDATCPSGKSAKLDLPMPVWARGRWALKGRWAVGLVDAGSARWRRVIVPRVAGIGFVATEVAPAR